MSERKKQIEIAKKKNQSRRFNIVIIIGIVIFSILGLIMRNSKLKHSNITICKIVGFGHASGGSGLRPEVVKFEYHVKGFIYNEDSSFPDGESIKVGDCYKLKYSIDDPKIAEVIFDEGKVKCDN